MSDEANNVDPRAIALTSAIFGFLVGAAAVVATTDQVSIRNPSSSALVIELRSLFGKRELPIAFRYDPEVGAQQWMYLEKGRWYPLYIEEALSID